ncbi:tyrosine-type recombinase/integrase [Nocardioides hwasunensis]|uniref:Site-specific integrase n=1 Tax=Nocardioides hwasunensis TaxID=397258 RepID=A0ABR8MM68_9ACTN|nr:site-specific integrase [Nocardioides hwasunensis]MBD3915900.1 site-specific integrase [Nocardioides hwasunensis]
MPRPRTPIGTFGEIHLETLPDGRGCASTRFRDYDGQLRRVQATAGSSRAAERKLKEMLAERAAQALGQGDLNPSSTFRHLVDVWLADLDLEGGLAPSTRDLYERNMVQLVLPAFENYALREISVRKVDQFIKTLAKTKSYSMAKQARTVLSLAFGLAVRYDAMRQNPVRDIARLRKPTTQVMSLDNAQIERIRRSARTWRRGPGVVGPPPDGQLEDVIEVMLGTSGRIGEVLAVRRCDINVTTTPATVRICGTIVSPRGKPTHRQPFPKTSKSTRTVSVPSFTAAALRRRLSKIESDDPEHLIFVSRNGTPLTTNNIRRRLRAVLDGAGISGVTPHSFRRTVATVIDRAGGADLAAEMLGHTSSEITKKHYIEPDEAVNPVTAEILESLAPRENGGDLG